VNAKDIKDKIKGTTWGKRCWRARHVGSCNPTAGSWGRSLGTGNSWEQSKQPQATSTTSLAVEAATSHKHHKPGSQSSHKPQAPQARQSNQPQAPQARQSQQPQATAHTECATLLCVPRTGRQHPPEQSLVPSNDVPIVLADAREGPGGGVLHVRVRIVNPSDHDRDALGEREIHRDNE
jgi:hypothetical protein